MFKHGLFGGGGDDDKKSGGSGNGVTDDQVQGPEAGNYNAGDDIGERIGKDSSSDEQAV